MMREFNWFCLGKVDAWIVIQTTPNTTSMSIKPPEITSTPFKSNGSQRNTPTVSTMKCKTTLKNNTRAFRWNTYFFNRNTSSIAFLWTNTIARHQIASCTIKSRRIARNESHARFMDIAVLVMVVIVVLVAVIHNQKSHKVRIQLNKMATISIRWRKSVRSFFYSKWIEVFRLAQYMLGQN